MKIDRAFIGDLKAIYAVEVRRGQRPRNCGALSQSAGVTEDEAQAERKKLCEALKRFDELYLLRRVRYGVCTRLSTRRTLLSDGTWVPAESRKPKVWVAPWNAPAELEVVNEA